MFNFQCFHLYKRPTHADIILFCNNQFNAINIECMMMMKTSNERITKMKNQTLDSGPCSSEFGTHHAYKLFQHTINWKRFANIISEKVLNYVAFCLRTQFRLKMRKRGSGTSIRLNIKEWNKKEHDARKEIEGLYFILRLFMADIRILTACKLHRFQPCTVYSVHRSYVHSMHDMCYVKM